MNYWYVLAVAIGFIPYTAEAQHGGVARYYFAGDSATIASICEGTDGGVIITGRTHLDGGEDNFVMETYPDGTPFRTMLLDIGSSNNTRIHRPLRMGSDAYFLPCTSIDTNTTEHFSCIGKYQDGSLQWLKRFMLDYTSVQFIEGPSGSVYAVHSLETNEFMVTRVDSKGEILFHKKYSHSILPISISIAPSPDGGLVAMLLPNSFYSAHSIVKIDSLGTVEWGRSVLLDNVEQLLSVAVAPDGAIVLSGNAPVANDGDTVLSVFIAELSGDGGTINRQRIAGYQNASRSVTTTSMNSSGILYIGIEHVDGGVRKNEIVQYDIAESAWWSRTIPVSVEQQNAVTRLHALDNGVLLTINDTYIALLDKLGDMSTECPAKETLLEFNESDYSVLLTNEHFAESEQELVLDEEEFSTQVLSPEVIYYCGNTTSVRDDKVNFNTCTVSPNPVKSGETVWMELPGIFTDVTITLVDFSGREVLRITQPELHSAGPNSTLLSIETKGLSAGTYMVRIEQGGEIMTTKFVIQ